jgi:hypothetical protein
MESYRETVRFDADRLNQMEDRREAIAKREEIMYVSRQEDEPVVLYSRPPALVHDADRLQRFRRRVQ